VRGERERERRENGASMLYVAWDTPPQHRPEAIIAGRKIPPWIQETVDERID